MLSIICSNVTRLQCEIPGPDYRVIISGRYQSWERLDHDQASITVLHPPHSPLDSHNLAGRGIAYQPLIHCRKLSVLALSVSGKTFWAGSKNYNYFPRNYCSRSSNAQLWLGPVWGWFIASPGITASPASHITGILQAETESIYNVLCWDWGHVFTWHNVYIIQTRIFTPELSSLLEFTKAIRSQWDHFISSAQTRGADIMRTWDVAWQASQPSSSITGNSVMSVMHQRWGWCSRCIHLSPPICGPCAWREEPHCVFPTICPHASFHSAPCQGGALHQHCLTASHLVSSLWSLCPQSSLLSLYTSLLTAYVAPSVPGSQLSAGAGMGWWPGSLLSVSAHYISHRPRVPVSASHCLGLTWRHAPWPMFSSDTICPPPVPSVFQSASHCLKCLNPEKLRWRPILVTSHVT